MTVARSDGRAHVSRVAGTDEPKRETDPDALARALEIELILQRASWQKARGHRGTWRALSILFLLLIVLGALFVWLFVAPQLRERRAEARAAERGR